MEDANTNVTGGDRVLGEEGGTIALPVCRCQRCGHSWIARKTELPVSCPHCRSRYWRTPLQRDRSRPYLSRCPMCPWVASFQTEEKAAERTLAHVREKHGEEAINKILAGEMPAREEAPPPIPDKLTGVPQEAAGATGEAVEPSETPESQEDAVAPPEEASEAARRRGRWRCGGRGGGTPIRGSLPLLQPLVLCER